MDRQISQAVLASEENLRAYHALRNAGQQIEDDIVAWLTAELRKIADEFGLTMTQPEALRENYGGFAFHNAKLTQGNITLNFEFERSGFRDFCAGIAFIDKAKGSTSKDSIKAKLEEIRRGKVHQSENWPAWFYWSEYQNWSDAKTWAATRYGQFLSDAKAVLRQLLIVGEQACIPKL